MEKILETKRILKISQRKIKMTILNVAYAREQVTPRNIVDGVGKSHVHTVRNLDIWRKIVTKKINIKQISLKSMSVRRINLTTSNIFSILHQ
jgi:DNA-binding protein